MTLSVLCAGAGWVTQARHLPALAADSRIRVIGIVDRHPERARAAAARYGLEHAGVSLDEPWTTDADCLTVGTPPLTHTDLVRAAVERGWHCLCEKPFMLPASEADEILSRARTARLVIGVVHNFQFSHAGARLFELLAVGRLGTIEAVYCFQLSNPRRRLPSWHPSLPGGLFLDEAPHLLYLLRRVLGRLEVRHVDARLAGTELRDVAATFEHESIWASLSMSFNASVSEWQFVVVGERAVAALDLFRDLLIIVPNDGAHRAREILRTSATLVGGHMAGFFSSGARLVTNQLSYGNDEVVRRFVDAVDGRSERLGWMAADDGVAVVACLEDILRRIGIDPVPPALS